MYGSKDILMWVYTHDIFVAQVTSGYASIRNCESAGRIYNFSVKGAQQSCATGCPTDAQTELEYKQYD